MKIHSSENGPQMVSQMNLLQAIEKLVGKEVVIVGDVMLDEYIFGSVDRISPEAPVPVVQVDKEEYRLGGAGNVARNIVALGGKAKLFGLFGNDNAARRLETMFNEHGIENCCAQVCDRPTTRKTRIIAQQQQIVRVDRESACSPSIEGVTALLQGLSASIANSPVLIVSDYGKGLISLSFMEEIHRMCRSMAHNPMVVVDPKPVNYPAYSGVHMLTPNTKEAGIEIPHVQTHIEQNSYDTEVVRAGRKLMRELHCEKLLITLGARGMMLFETDRDIMHIPTAARKVYDVTGAGDTVIAVLGLALAAGLPARVACLLANYAAGIVVGHVGATSVDQAQLRNAVLTWPSLSARKITAAELKPGTPSLK